MATAISAPLAPKPIALPADSTGFFDRMIARIKNIVLSILNFLGLHREQVEKSPEIKEVVVLPKTAILIELPPPEIEIPAKQENLPSELALTTSDKIITLSNAFQWGLIGAGLCGVGTTVTAPLGFLAALGCDIAQYSQLPEDASWLRRAFSFPFVSRTILGSNPLIYGLSKVVSFYNSVQQSGSKLYNTLHHIPTDPKNALRSGFAHLFNLASTLAFAADSAGLIQIPKRPAASEKSDSPCKPGEHCKREITIGTAYSNENDPVRDEYAKAVDNTHQEYANKWNLKHVVNHDRSLLQNQCIRPNKLLEFGTKKADCSSYWLKIPALKEWLEQPKNPNVDEEWRFLIDDDMPITNMNIDPNQAISALRDQSDASVILVKDPVNWTEWRLPQSKDPRIAINGGLWMVRKDARALDFINRVWETRNILNDPYNTKCPNFGLCLNQEVLHEQEGTARVLHEDPSLIDKVVSIVPPRDPASKTRSHIALNTFHGQNNQCYVDQNKHLFRKNLLHSNPNAMWKKGDWMGQPSGLPTIGKELGAGCKESSDIPVTHLRYQKIQEMVQSAE